VDGGFIEANRIDAVAENLSPTRDSLLDNVSFSRTFKLVPTGTTGTLTGARLAAQVCAGAVSSSFGRCPQFAVPVEPDK